MFDIKNYINKLLILLNEKFKSRLLYVGLQGSYLRNEAYENSDIDIMIIIDDMQISDLDEYKNILVTVGYFDKSCGFICGKSEMQNWNPLEICHLVNTTKDLYGKLKEFVPIYTIYDEKNYIKLCLNNLYHEICHRYIHSNRENNIQSLPQTYKSVFFIIQNLYYLESGTFINSKSELIKLIKNEDKAVLEMAIKIKENKEYDFNYAFELLFSWCKNKIVG